MLTPKENLYRMYHGEIPEYIPRGGFREFKCSGFVDIKAPGYHKDEFGVEYIGKDDVFGGAPIPMPGKYILHDITKWRDVIKAPDLSGFDWESMAKKDLEKIDRSTTGVVYYGGKIFQRLADFMGFTEGLCAIAEEPEECKALYDYLADYNCEILKNIMHYYKPDAVCIPDDTATALAPFISPETYRELVKPAHMREAEVVLNGGAFIDMHDCGHCEAFIDDWMDFHITSWNPAQPSNDIPAIKKKYGRKLIIAGGWDSQGPLAYSSVPEDELREALINYVDTCAPNGGFVFSAFAMGKPYKEGGKSSMQIVNEVYEEYAKNWYQTH